MDRSDSEQEGITLPPVDQIVLLVRNEVAKSINSHLLACPFVSLEIEKRLRNTENKFSLLVGLMIGSGLLGGVTGTVLQRLLP